MYVRKRAKNKPDSHGVIEEPEEVSRLGDYQVMESIGKGAFGQVFRGLCITSAETVAIKRVNLQGVPKEELDAIEMEIKLLQGLDHPNIVKYKDALRSERHLNIVLEFIESGSLSSLLNKFKGSMPEHLVALYTAQVLVGLHYLHSQGVIHRDIKGANILSTKEGLVKLADFGVATKLNESRKSNSVVGTPYWMAPEIIEMTGQQSYACDIWSVGCTVIELLTGKPPYYDLQQMAALFRIVQDDHPPLPDNISPACKSFLLECFQKDPNRRIDALGLSKHAWVKELVQQHKNRMVRGAQVAQVTTEAADEKDEISEDWDAELEDDPDINLLAIVSMQANEHPVETPLETKHIRSATDVSVNLKKWAEEDADEEWGDIDDVGSLSPEFPDDSPNSGTGGDMTPVESGDLEDSEFQPFGTGLPGMKKSPPGGGAGGAGGMEGLSSTNTPLYRGSAAANELNLLGEPTLGASAHPVAIADSFAALTTFKEDDSDNEDWDIDFIPAKPAMSLDEGIPDEMESWSDEGDESDPFDKIDFAVDQDTTTTILAEFNRLLGQIGPNHNEVVLIETCAKLSAFVQENGTILGDSTTCRAVIPIIESLETTNTDVILALLKLINSVILESEKFMINLALGGLIPAVINFSSERWPQSVRDQVSSFICVFCQTSEYARKMFVSCGGIAALVNFLHQSVNHESFVKGKQSLFNSIDCIRSIFEITSSPRNDFCRLFCKNGLLVSLVKVLAILYCSSIGITKDSELSKYNTLNMVEIQRGVSKQLAVVDRTCHEYVIKVCDIIGLFSSGDQTVKDYFADATVLNILVTLAPCLPQEGTSTILKTLRVLSLNPAVLDILDTVQAIPKLMLFFESKHFENTSQTLQIMYYMCNLYSLRQDQAAKYGIVPYLVRLVQTKHPLQQFALPLLFSMAKNAAGRRYLRQYDCFYLYLDLLVDPYWRTFALDSIKEWLINDTPSIEFMLNQPSHLIKIIQVFSTTRTALQFETIMGIYKKLLAIRTLAIAIGECEAFITDLLSRLTCYSDNNNIRIGIFQIIRLLTLSSDKCRNLIVTHASFKHICTLAKQDEYLLLASYAHSTLVDLLPNMCLQPSLLEDVKFTLSKMNADKKNAKNVKLETYLNENVQGRTVLHLACASGHLDIIKFLIACGKCDINEKDSTGATPMQIANELGHVEVVKYLQACS